MNPGGWIQHSVSAGQAAAAISTHHPELDPEVSYVLGCLHDIGRREGVTGMRHVIDGFNFLRDREFEDAARICLTHSFPIQNVHTALGKWDCPNEEFLFVEDYLSRVQYTDYDRLIQLCDGLASSSGLVLIEKRLMGVALRYGTNEYTIAKWKAFFDLQRMFEESIGESIYRILPGVVENTFGFDPTE